jgi:hypothetical protein
MALQSTSAPTLSIPAGSTATTTTATVLDNGHSMANHSCYITIAGTLTAGLVALETSLDNVNWTGAAAQGGQAITAAGFSTGTGVYVLTLTGCPAQFVRAQITTTITGGTITAWVASSNG